MFVKSTVSGNISSRELKCALLPKLDDPNSLVHQLLLSSLSVSLNVILFNFLISPMFLSHQFSLSRLPPCTNHLTLHTPKLAQIRSTMSVDGTTSPTLTQAQGCRPVQSSAITSKPPADDALEDPTPGPVPLPLSITAYILEGLSVPTHQKSLRSRGERYSVDNITSYVFFIVDPIIDAATPLGRFH